MIEVDGTNVTLTKGDTERLRIEVTDADGNPYELRDGEYVELVVKNKHTDATALIRKVAVDGVVDFERADTWGLKVGRYEYQVRVEDGTDEFHTIIDGTFAISKVVDDASY